MDFRVGAFDLVWSSGAETCTISNL